MIFLPGSWDRMPVSYQPRIAGAAQRNLRGRILFFPARISDEDRGPATLCPDGGKQEDREWVGLQVN